MSEYADFSVIIPARYASRRLPGKPLEKIAGKTMIHHVYDRALSSGAGRVIIATDDERINNEAQGFNAQVCMTSSEHQSGTDRIAEVIDKLEIPDDHIIVNLQGDELFMPAVLIRQVATNLLSKHDSQLVMATLMTPIVDVKELFDPNVVKVVVDKNNCAIYFSRAPIPWQRDSMSFDSKTLPEGSKFYRHIGLYSYKAKFVKQYVNWSAAPIECTESLEQLRVLWNGYKIHVAESSELPFPGVDTKEDLERAIVNYEEKWNKDT